MDRKVKTLLKGAGLEHLIGGRVGIQDGPMTAAELAQQEEYYKQHPEVKAENEAYTKQAQINSAAESRRRADEQTKRNQENRLARETEEAKYQAWLKQHGKVDTTANLQGDEALMSRSTDPTYQLYMREQEQARNTPEAARARATADIEAAKKKLAEPMYNLEGNINLKEAKAFGLPRNAKFKDLVAAVEAAKAKGELNQDQRNYSGRAEGYKSLTAVAQQTPDQALLKQYQSASANNQAELKRLGLQTGVNYTPEQIAQARAEQAAKGKEQYITDRERKKRVAEWEAIKRSEEKRIKDQMFEAKKYIKSKLTDDKVANLDWLRMDREMTNGEILRRQIYQLQEDALEHDLETPEEYVEAVNAGKLHDKYGNLIPPIVIYDAEKATDEQMKELESKIGFFDKVGHYGLVGSLMLADIAAEVLPYIMPAFGTALSLGWKAFAPEGSMNYQEGTVGQKFGRLGLSIVEEGAKKLIGLGQQKRRKQMEKLMDDEVKLHGGARHSFTKDGLKQYKEWITRNIKIEHISLTELNNLKTILTNGTDIPASEIQKVVLEFGTDWNRAINTMVDLTQEGNSSSTIAFPPQPVRKRASGRGKGSAKKKKVVKEE